MIVSMVSSYDTYLGGLFIRLTFLPLFGLLGTNCGVSIIIYRFSYIRVMEGLDGSHTGEVVLWWDSVEHSTTSPV